MHSEKTDITGWLLAAIVVTLAAYVAVALGSSVGVAIALALITLVAIERRRSKVITASLIRVADEAGGVRGLVAWDGEGIQIGVLASTLSNRAAGYRVLWQKEASVSFSFRPATTITGGVIEHAPAIGVFGVMGSQWPTYAMEFSYDSAKMEPALCVTERGVDATVVHHIRLC